MATGTKFSTRTKHITLKYHHFISHVKPRRVDIHYRPTGEQLADLLNKLLSPIYFAKYTKTINHV